MSSKKPKGKRTYTKTKVITKPKKVTGKKSSIVKLNTSLFTRQAHAKASAPPLINPSISEAIFNEIRSGGVPQILQQSKRTGKKTTTYSSVVKPVKKVKKVIVKKIKKVVKKQVIPTKVPKAKLAKMRLRGKILDLRKMGVINNKRTPSKGKQSAKRLPISKNSTKTPSKPKTPK